MSDTASVTAGPTPGICARSALIASIMGMMRATMLPVSRSAGSCLLTKGRSVATEFAMDVIGSTKGSNRGSMASVAVATVVSSRVAVGNKGSMKMSGGPVGWMGSMKISDVAVGSNGWMKIPGSGGAKLPGKELSRVWITERRGWTTALNVLMGTVFSSGKSGKSGELGKSGTYGIGSERIGSKGVSMRPSSTDGTSLGVGRSITSRLLVSGRSSPGKVPSPMPGSKTGKSVGRTSGASRGGKSVSTGKMPGRINGRMFASGSSIEGASVGRASDMASVTLSRVKQWFR